MPLYLHTSPEFCMKELLSAALDILFTISYCFHDDPQSPIHRPQFLMLEWYRQNQRYEKIMQDAEELIHRVMGSAPHFPLRKELQKQNLVKKTMQELFQEELGIDILEYLDVESIKKLLKNFTDVPVPPSELEWD